MLYSVIKKNSYQDSINLMLLTKQLSDMEGLKKVTVMMGTPANMDIMKNAGLYTPELETATPSDICIVVDSDTSEVVDIVLEAVEHFIKNQSVAAKSDHTLSARSWDSALRKMPDANWALVSIAGEYAAQEADKALEHGLHVMLFSDNISVEDELALKTKAAEKDLLVMGPDCGTAIISGVPLAFANTLEKGNIGVIGASGTGIQEVTTLISRAGGGCSQVIGLGGRDLTKGIGGIMALRAIDLLRDDDETDIIVFISKPPASEVRKEVVEKLLAQPKPVVAIFLGEKLPSDGNIQYAWTLEETARRAVELSKSRFRLPSDRLNAIRKNSKQRGIQGIYSGGTLAAEAGMMLADVLGLSLDTKHPAGVMFAHEDHKIIDMGDDAYTRGKPHPMIDPSSRLAMLQEVVKNESTAIVLMDFVIGYGGTDDVAEVFAPAIASLREELSKEGRDIFFVASVTGTNSDPVPYNQQKEELEDAGVYILDSNAEAVEFALAIVRGLNEPAEEKNTAVRSTIWDKPRVVNMGIKHFAPPIVEHGGKVLQFMWNPPAGGDSALAELLAKLYAI